ncbi:MAG: hypothetical protein CM1200mP33_2070 [Chloroflexota bacterium]|nr:MAG: hypothetical protein CM1200mP33_2070 [Chloroflexota bacterium]
MIKRGCEETDLDFQLYHQCKSTGVDFQFEQEAPKNCDVFATAPQMLQPILEVLILKLI